MPANRTLPSPLPARSPYLGDPKVLNRMAHNACAAFDRVWAISGSGERYTAFVTYLDADVAALLGLDPENYNGLMGWNTVDGGLPRQVQRRYGGDAADPVGCIKGAFCAMIQFYIQAVNDVDAGKEWKPGIEHTITLLVNTLLGIDQLTHPNPIAASNPGDQ